MKKEAMRKLLVIILSLVLLTAWSNVVAQPRPLDDDLPPLPVIPTAQPTATPLPAGTGLKGEYFNTPQLTSRVLTRIDPTINFAWRAGSPDPRIGSDTFSARWTGFVKPRYDGLYTFSVRVDNGVRLWVGNQLIIDDWRAAAPREVRGTINVVAEQPLPIRLEFFESTGGASVRLYWQSLTQNKELIPQQRLYPAS